MKVAITAIEPINDLILDLFITRVRLESESESNVWDRDGNLRYLFLADGSIAVKLIKIEPDVSLFIYVDDLELKL